MSGKCPIVQILPAFWNRPFMDHPMAGAWLKWLKAAVVESNHYTAYPWGTCDVSPPASLCVSSQAAQATPHRERAAATGVYLRAEAAVLMSSGLAASRMSSSGSSERPSPSRTMMAKMMEAKLLSSFTWNHNRLNALSGPYFLLYPFNQGTSSA